ncbi:hypothetical protein DB88DRAFT_511716 [Papiliotrema laurentii]|uniref:Uncharacterized protein n=1 Tax=Papiliotrema laurentii TaxID=5418 RepID=A0AAD9FQI1_PAPLA|nr:hypothetical protein DB88DRAFT_511716 [Papiliotrema laurentii]
MSDSTGTPPVATSSGLTQKMIGFAGFGCLVRVFQLAILKKPYSTAPQTYLYSAVGWGGVGYLWYHAEIRQKTLLYKAEQEFASRREKQREALSSSLGSAIPQ